MRFITCLSFFIILFHYASAQEESIIIYQAKRYVEFNIKSLDRYNGRVQTQQVRLLKNLKRKEGRYVSRLKTKDSVAYLKYQSQPLTFDSISSLQKDGPKADPKYTVHAGSTAVDSLKKIEFFITDKLHLQGQEQSALPSYNTKLSEIQSSTDHNNYINQLITQRFGNLKTINSNTKGKVGGFKGIDKQVFYAKEKIKVFKNINDEPSKLEDKALEVLQGTDGFEQHMQGGDPGSMAALSAKGASTSDLEKMGYQTRRQMNERLQKKFGSNLGGLQQKMGGQIKDYQDQLKKLQSAQTTVQQTKGSLKSLKTDKPTFKINPMRGLPFFKRIEKQFNWQTTRATLDGKPAMFQPAAMVGFKHTESITYGVGISTSIGLGQGFNNIKLTIQSLGLRSYASCQLIYGIAGYVGYERNYKLGIQEVQQADINSHNGKNYNESILVGLIKTYNINDKWNGSMQVLYDIWWKEKGLKSPIVLRIATLKK